MKSTPEWFSLNVRRSLTNFRNGFAMKKRVKALLDYCIRKPTLIFGLTLVLSVATYVSVYNGESHKFWSVEGKPGVIREYNEPLANRISRGYYDSTIQINRRANSFLYTTPFPLREKIKKTSKFSSQRHLDQAITNRQLFTPPTQLSKKDQSQPQPVMKLSTNAMSSDRPLSSTQSPLNTTMRQNDQITVRNSSLPGGLEHTILTTNQTDQTNQQSNENATRFQQKNSTKHEFASSSSRAPKMQGTQIPRILHQAFTSEMVYSNYKPMIESCLRLNPDWTYYLWRDKDAEALTEDRLPEFAARYKIYQDGLQKSDSIRYIVLYLFGGIYLDMDVECVRPFYPALSKESAFLDQERVEQTNIWWSKPFCAMNSVMGGPKGHPFYRDLINAVSESDPKASAVHSTGPFILTRVFEQYSRGAMASNWPVRLLEPRIMSPLMDTQKNWRALCNGAENLHLKPVAARNWRDHGCLLLKSKNWRLNDTDNSTLAIHRFLHLGYDFAAHQRARLFNMTEIYGSRLNYYLNKRNMTDAP